MSPIIKKEQVSIATPEQTLTRRRRGHAKAANLLRVDGQVRAIEVSCSCGEKMVIELDYEQGAMSEPATPALDPPLTPEASSPAETSAEHGPAEETPS